MKNIARVVIAAVLLIVFAFVPVEGAAKLLLYLVPYLIAGYDVLCEAFEGITHGELFDENFLMSIATLGALILGEYSEASAVMIFYKVGELFEDYAEDKTRANITRLMNIRPDYANIENDGEILRVSPDDVRTGSIIIIRPGEKIPIDGTIIEGHSTIDTSSLTGESLPKSYGEGDNVMSGCVNLSGVLRVKTSCEFSQSTAAKILDLVENASSRKAKTEHFITRFAKIYTPAVCACALGLAVIPPLFAGNFAVWVYRALTFLVISCPCALVISVPLAFFAGIGGAGRRGVLVKGSNFLEMLAKTSCVVFDKTGTLTRGVFSVVAVHPEILSERELLHLSAHVERYSPHPVAEALRNAYPDEADTCDVQDVEEIPGYGVKAKVNGRIIHVGSSRLMEKVNASWHPCEKSGTVIHVAVDGKYAGHVVISDVLKPTAKEAVNALKVSGLHVAMLTGDTQESARDVAESAGISEVYGGLLPADKVSKVEEFMRRGEVVAFVGDGINDAPVISRADVGIAMGGLGSDAAIEAADVVLMDDDPLKVPLAVRISRKVMLIVRENIYFSVGVKLLCLVLGASGLAGMWAAVFADVGVMVLAVMNALRALFV